MPRRFTAIAAILLGVIAIAQAVRAFTGVDVVVNGYHVPVMMSWIAAAVAGIIAVLAFREAGS